MLYIILAGTFEGDEFEFCLILTFLIFSSRATKKAPVKSAILIDYNQFSYFDNQMVTYDAVIASF